MDELKYPIGKYNKPEAFTSQLLHDYIFTIESFPQKIKHETEQLAPVQLDTPYRPEGWTVRQVVHHCSDSHMNAVIRLKLALTEETPVITAYKEALWSELPDTKTLPVHPALHILEGLHARWVSVLRTLSAGQWSRAFIHPEHGRRIPLNESTGMYAWHCEHHLAHITRLKERMHWK